jgi:hypothetical protein
MVYTKWHTRYNPLDNWLRVFARRRWEEVLSLARDGVAFTRGRVLGQRGRVGRPPGLRAPLSPDAPARAPHKKKTKQAESSPKKRGDGKASQKPGGVEDSTAAAAAATDAEPAPPAPREWQPTRSPYLAVGARETGVKLSMS